jgi:hypothetical protein
MQARHKGGRTERQASSSPLIRCLGDLQQVTIQYLANPGATCDIGPQYHHGETIAMVAKSLRHPCNQLGIPADIGNAIPMFIKFLIYPRSPFFHHASTGW